jgi:aarF domain-containing kinase
MSPRTRRSQGQHLFDLLRLTYASRNVARKHAQLRAAQWERLRRSSGAAQEVETQLRQVVDGAKAAAALLRRFLEDDAKEAWKAQEEVWRNREGGIPKSEEPNQAETKINEDITDGTIVSEAANLGNDLEAPPGIDVNVFRTKKVAKMLSKKKGESSPTPIKLETSSGIEQSIGSDSAPLKSSLDRDQSSLSQEAQLNASQDSVVAEKVDPQEQPYHMRESRVPSTRFGRLWQYGGLATSMAFGAVGETLRRATGSSTGGSLVLGPKNMERLVAKLSRMRGAALKLGQMISFQGNALL